MHVYRYQYKNYNRSHDKRKKRRRILPVTILIVAAAVILSGGVRLEPGELGFLLQEEIMGFFLPPGLRAGAGDGGAYDCRPASRALFFAPGREWCICRLSDAGGE